MNMVSNWSRSVYGTMRSLASMFPGIMSSTKHDHYADYGWPREVTFDMLYHMHRRNGLAKAAVAKIASRTWETLPTFAEDVSPQQTPAERRVEQHMRRIRLFQSLHEVSWKAAVGGYAGAILRLADSRDFDQPISGVVPGGLQGLVEVVPAWAGQLRVSRWNTDPNSMDYGKPAMFHFRESGVQEGTHLGYSQPRSFDVHPDRVIVWSADGTVFAESLLEAGFNDLIDLEKIKGAGGEGFWRNAKAAPVIEADAESNFADIAKAMGVEESELFDRMNEQVQNYQSGYDQMMFLQGMKANPTSITLNSPKEFFQTSVQSFAASVEMPFRVLVGNETGERASTEDDRTFSRACMSRRQWIEMPMMEEFLRRLVAYGILPNEDWFIQWPSLLDSTPEDKMSRAKSMAVINRTMQGPGQDERADMVFPIDEVRREAGFLPNRENSGDAGEPADEPPVPDQPITEDPE